jgi:hypothetical protein
MKEVIEQRLPFSDYPAEEQERDAKRAKRLKIIRHAYLMRIDGEWAHFIVSQQGDDIGYYDEMKLLEVVEKLKRTRPEYTPKVIMNEGLENYLRDRRPEYKKRMAKQLTINFDGGKEY